MNGRATRGQRHDAVDAAMTAVSADDYVLDPAGQRLPQSSAPDSVAAVLRLLDVQPANRVLELGTGSGYSTALLAHLTGATGDVVSLDIDPALTARAARLLASHGFRHARTVTSNGRFGLPAAAPYDRIVSWATVETIPSAWSNQMRPGGLIVAPVQILPLAHAGIAVGRLRLVSRRVVVGEQVVAGLFVPLTDTPLRDWSGLLPHGDVSWATSEGARYWLSAAWLRSKATRAARTQVQMLLEAATPQPTPLDVGEDPKALQAYLIATAPDGLTSASIPEAGVCLGYSQTDGLALLAMHSRHYIQAGEPAAALILARWIAAWRALGRPSWDNVKPIAEPVHEGWRVQITLGQPGSSADEADYSS